MEYLEKVGSDIEQLESRFFGNQVTPDTKEVTSTEVQEPVIESKETLESSTQTTIESKEISVDDPEETPEKKKERNDWKNRYKTYKAATDVTIHNLRQEVAIERANGVKLENELNIIKNELQQMKTNPDELWKDFLSEEESDIVGETTLSVMKRATQKAVDAAVKPIQEALDRERTLRLEESNNRSKDLQTQNQNQFANKLEELVPGFSKYDTDVNFHAWMAEPDPVSGISREALFRSSQKLGDVVGVARFFKDYMSEINERTELLDSNVTPTKQTATTVQKQQPKVEVITMKFINDFYDDCVRGKYKGKLKLQQEIEQKIDTALREGRVQK